MSDPTIPQKPPFEETEVYLSILRKYWQGMDRLDKNSEKSEGSNFIRNRMDNEFDFSDSAKKLTRKTRKKIEDLRGAYNRGEL